MPAKSYASRATEDFGIPDIDEVEPELNEKFDTIAVVDNIPVIGLAKIERLCGVIRKIFGAWGTIKELHVPTNAEDMTKGFCFIEYETKQMCAKAVELGDGKKLDNSHKFRVVAFADYQKFIDTPEEYTAPPEPEVNCRSNLNSWLLDPTSRDQYVVRSFSDVHETEIFWNEPYKASDKEGRVLNYGGDREKDRNRSWTESVVAWSPQGTYLATFHRQGIVLWGGDGFEKLGRFGHANVRDVDFSPCEKYMATSAGNDIQIWDVRSAKMLRSFPKVEGSWWPDFKWSPDDKYFGRVGVDCISIYETPSMGLADKKSIKIPGVKTIAWSPTENILAYWVPEKDNIPSSVVLMELPSRKMIRERHFYNVVDINLTWQANGDYLCVRIARRKTKKTIIHNFEIFRMRQKNIPVEVLEMTDNIIKFSFEPKGNRFCVIHGNPAKPSVSWHRLKRNTLELIKTMENRVANDVFWSPSGEHCVLAGLGEKSGALEFFNCTNMQSVCETEHHMCTDVTWDPSGRYLITSTTQFIEPGQNWRAAMENGYKVWSAHGQLLSSVNYEMCFQVLWRPRPKSLLSNEQLKSIKENLKDKYWKKFEAEDDEIRLSQQSAEQKEKLRLRNEWKTYRAEREAEYASEESYRVTLRYGLLSDDEEDYVESEIITEEEISCETIVLDA